MILKRSLRSKATVKTYDTYYGVTVSKHQKTDYVDKSDLDQVLTELKLRLNTLNILHQRYENSGKYRQLHVHTYCKLNEYINYRDHCSINGFHVKFDRLRKVNDRQ